MLSNLGILAYIDQFISFYVMREMQQPIGNPRSIGTVGLAQGVGLMQGLHLHDEIECNFVCSGTARYLVAGHTYEIKKGAMIWLFPEQEHTLLDFSTDFSMWVLLFRKTVFEKLQLSDNNRHQLQASHHDGQYCKYLNSQASHLLSKDLEEVATLSEDDLDMNKVTMPYLLLRSWDLFQEAEYIPNNNLVHPSIEKTARILQDRDYDLPELAAQVGFSPSHLSRLFKQQTGISFSHFRNQRRLERFFCLYGSGQSVTALQACLEAGFGSYAQFNRVCKQITGGCLRDTNR